MLFLEGNHPTHSAVPLSTNSEYINADTIVIYLDRYPYKNRVKIELHF